MRYSIIVILLVIISCTEPEIEPEYISPDPTGKYVQQSNNSQFPSLFSVTKIESRKEYYPPRYYMDYDENSIDFFLLTDVKEAQLYRTINFYDSLNRILIFNK